MFVPELKAASPHLNGMPEIVQLFAFNPLANKYLAAFTHEVMRGSSGLSVGEREMLAALTSKLNSCEF
jgi:alkylhydroperoxidase family enzyme